jgi:hypothetical protein
MLNRYTKWQCNKTIFLSRHDLRKYKYVNSTNRVLPKYCRLIPVISRSKVGVCGRSLAGIAGSNPSGVMDVCCERCVLLGTGLWGGLITGTEESYRVWCVWVWSWRRSRHSRGCRAMKEQCNSLGVQYQMIQTWVTVIYRTVLHHNMLYCTVLDCTVLCNIRWYRHEWL